MAYNWKNGRLAAGVLRHRIDIVTVSPVQDSAGGIDLNVNVIYANVWASVEAMTGTESFAAGAQNTVVTHQVVIRYIGAAPSWQSGYDYLPGALVKDSNGYLQQAQEPGGISDADAPTWNQTEGDETTDGNPSINTFAWLNLGVAPPRTGVTSTMQVWFGDRQFQITSVQNPDERTKMLCLSCYEINDSRQQSTSAQPGGLT